MNINIKGHVDITVRNESKAQITIDGNVGTGVAENMMSGKVHVKGNASQSAGATHMGVINNWWRCKFKMGILWKVLI